jgi:hypothetical protein
MAVPFAFALEVADTLAVVAGIDQALSFDTAYSVELLVIVVDMAGYWEPDQVKMSVNVPWDTHRLYNELQNCNVFCHM